MTTMHPLWISKLILLFICFAAASMALNIMALDGGAVNYIPDCNSVPYPFGVQGVALKGFEVLCTSSTTQNRTDMLPSDSTTQNRTDMLLSGSTTGNLQILLYIIIIKFILLIIRVIKIKF
jgi:hypothetical protein